MATAAHDLPAQRRPSAVLALWAVLCAVVLAVTQRAKVNGDLLLDLAVGAAVTAGVAGLAGSWWGLITAAVAVQVIREFGGNTPTRR